MRKRIWGCFLILFVLSLFTSGCYYFKAKDEMSKAAQMISELKAAGGQQKALYEYTSAEKLLESSRAEFNQNDYQHSIDFATRAQAAAMNGLSAVKK
jgi:hypothetical protein